MIQAPEKGHKSSYIDQVDGPRVYTIKLFTIVI
jgi:hypothetical protein